MSGARVVFVRALLRRPQILTKSSYTTKWIFQSLLPTNVYFSWKCVVMAVVFKVKKIVNSLELSAPPSNDLLFNSKY